MNALSALAPRSPSALASSHADEMGLSALLDLFDADDADQAAAGHAPERRSLRKPGVGLRTWTAHWVSRATYWGASPQGGWRA